MSQYKAKNHSVVKTRVTTIPFRDWSLRARAVERLYRWTHGGQIRTLVIRPW